MKKENNMKKEVVLKITSQRGHDTLKLQSTQALEVIRTETKDKGKWCYVDGQFRSSDTLSESDLEKAENIVVVNQLLGG